MANNDGKKFDIELGTTADTSGLEAVKRELEAVEQAGKDAANPMTDGSQLAAQRDATEATRETTRAIDETTRALGESRRAAEDLDEARRRASDRRVEDLKNEALEEKRTAEAAREAAIAKTAVIGAVLVTAKQALGAVMEASAAARELGVELTPGMEAFVRTVEAARDPVGAILEGFTGINAELKALEESQRRAAEMEQRYLKAVKAREEELRQAALGRISVMERLNKQAIDEQTAAYERQLRVINALAAADEARIRAAEAQGLANGTTDAATVDANRAARDSARQSTEAGEKVKETQRNIDQLNRDLVNLGNQLDEAERGDLTKKAAELRLKIDDTRAAIGDAQLELDTVETEAAATKTAIASKAVESQQGVVTDTGRALTDAAREAKETLEAEAKEQGRQLTAGGKESLRLLTEALKDGVVTPEEMAAITQAIQQVKNSRDAADAEIMKSFGLLEQANTAAIAALRAMQERQAAQVREIEQLRFQIANPQQ